MGFKLIIHLMGVSEISRQGFGTSKSILPVRDQQPSSSCSSSCSSLSMGLNDTVLLKLCSLILYYYVVYYVVCYVYALCSSPQVP